MPMQNTKTWVRSVKILTRSHSTLGFFNSTAEMDTASSFQLSN